MELNCPPSQQLVINEKIHEVIFKDLIPSARRFVWIATADLKDLHFQRTARKFDTFLALFDDLVADGIEVRLIHAKEPGTRFRRDFDRFPRLIHSDLFERVLCPRNHMKAVIVDGRRALITSANLTGAGMGAKSVSRRNFECGILLETEDAVTELMDFFDRIFIGDFCLQCDRRDYCPDPIL
ncbi:MAG: phospholipase D-like domain-containing protein [Verrucomicrobiota bacterium]